MRSVDSMLQELLDREAIKELKARYFRCVDTKDWEGFRQVFTADAEFDLMDDEPVRGADNFVETVRGMCTDCRTVHHGHMPELTFVSSTEVHGIWVLADYLEWEPDPATGERRGVKGYGHERETYRKIDGEWKIAKFQLSYLRLDPLPLAPLPAQALGGPEILREGVYVDL